MCRARSASNRWPVLNRARACDSPIFGSTNVLITAGTMPSFVSVKPNVASVVAITTSATAHSPIPPPRAAPWTRAMTGTGQASIASNIACMAVASRSFSSVDRPMAARIHVTSAPALNVVPAPASTTPRNASGDSAAKPVKAARNASISSTLNALRTSGRASVTRANTS